MLDEYATDRKIMYRDIELMKSIGCNYVRGSHYPQSEEFLDLCDEMGLMVWEESLGWGNRESSMTNELFQAQQIRETEAMAVELLRGFPEAAYAMVNEAGASVYSASEIARKEFPDLDLSKVPFYTDYRKLLDDADNKLKGVMEK